MTGIDQAAKRMMDALDALDVAIARRFEAERSNGSAAGQADAASIGHADFRSELASVQARAHRLEIANRAAARHIDEAMTAIRTLISAHQ